MDLELLDVLEEKVDVAVGTVQELRVENDELREETDRLQKKIHGLTKDLETASTTGPELEELREKCRLLEDKLHRVRARIEEMVGKMKSLEG